MQNAITQSERTAVARQNNWLAPAGTAMAMLACYGVTAAIGVLSLIGISMALPFRAPVIVLFSAIAAASLASSYRRHQSGLVVVLGLVGFVLVAGSKFLPPDLKADAIGIEAAGFLCMVGGNILAFRARRQAGLSCTVRRAV